MYRPNEYMKSQLCRRVIRPIGLLYTIMIISLFLVNIVIVTVRTRNSMQKNIIFSETKHKSKSLTGQIQCQELA